MTTTRPGRCWPRCGIVRRLTFASKVEAGEVGSAVTREVEARLQTMEVKLPAVVTADLRLNEPRYVSLPDIIKARRSR